MEHESVKTRNGCVCLENEYLRVWVHQERCWFEVEDKRSGVVWEHDPWYDTVGELVVINRATGTKHTCFLSDAEQKKLNRLLMTRMLFRFGLNALWITPTIVFWWTMSA